MDKAQLEELFDDVAAGIETQEGAIEKILAAQAGQLAEGGDPRIVATLRQNDVYVELHNWTGTSMAMMERMYHKMIVEVQRQRAVGLQQMRQAQHKEMNDA